MDSMTLKLGQVQLMVGRDKAENLRRACVLIRRAAEQGAQLVMLPEMFCCPYENEMFRPNSEEQGGPAQQALSALSRELGIWIVGNFPLAFQSNFPESTITPPRVVPWPPINFVAECTTISAPCSIGRIRYGVPKVLSTKTGMPCLCAISAIASISGMSLFGFPSVSK